MWVVALVLWQWPEVHVAEGAVTATGGATAESVRPSCLSIRQFEYAGGAATLCVAELTGDRGFVFVLFSNHPSSVRDAAAAEKGAATLLAAASFATNSATTPEQREEVGSPCHAAALRVQPGWHKRLRWACCCPYIALARWDANARTKYVLL